MSSNSPVSYSLCNFLSGWLNKKYKSKFTTALIKTLQRLPHNPPCRQGWFLRSLCSPGHCRFLALLHYLPYFNICCLHRTLGCTWFLGHCGLSTNPCRVTHRVLVCEEGSTGASGWQTSSASAMVWILLGLESPHLWSFCLWFSD